jgi:hypothetical protein
MSTICLVADLNDMIIDKFIHDYPTFRRFLLTIGNDREQIAHYIRKYLPKFTTEEYAYISQIIPGISMIGNYHISKLTTKYGLIKNSMIIFNNSEDIPFVDGVDSIYFTTTLKNLEKTRSYSNVNSIYICGPIKVSPEDFAQAFPNLRIFRCIDEDFIDKLLAINSNIKKIIYDSKGISDINPLKYPNVEFHSWYNTNDLLETAHFIKNLKCVLEGRVESICNFIPVNHIIESLKINVDTEKDSHLVIPKHYKDIRFLTISIYYAENKNIEIVIDGFPFLELINIVTNLKGRAKCKISNVPYIFYLGFDKSCDLDIDYETVTILEYKK